MKSNKAWRDYGAEWIKARKIKVEANPMCEEPGCNRRTQEVDHIVPLRDGGTHAQSNLRSLCKSHHMRKTAREIGNRRRKAS